jgi:hypothetical protein
VIEALVESDEVTLEFSKCSGCGCPTPDEFQEDWVFAELTLSTRKVPAKLAVAVCPDCCVEDIFLQKAKEMIKEAL